MHRNKTGSSGALQGDRGKEKERDRESRVWKNEREK
jgi:hypothetical protein